MSRLLIDKLPNGYNHDKSGDKEQKGFMKFANNFQIPRGSVDPGARHRITNFTPTVFYDQQIYAAEVNSKNDMFDIAVGSEVINN